MRFVLFALGLLASGAFAAEVDVAPPSPRITGSPFLRVWQPEDYGGSPVNWRIVQHPVTGFIYATNNLGLLEYDGARWNLLRMPRGGSARALAIDPAGRIWVGGIGEIARFEPDAQGLLHAVDVTDLVAAGATGREAAEDAEDAASRSNGPAPLSALGTLNRAAAGPGGVYFRLPDTIAQFLPDGTVQLRPAAGRFGQLFVLDGELHVENLERGVMRLDHGALGSVPGMEKLRMFGGRPVAGGGWQLLTSRGPQFWPGPGRVPAPPAVDVAELFNGEEPTCAVLLAAGRSAYGTTRSGVFVFAADGRLERRIDRTNGLPSNRVNGLAEDAEGGLWLAQHTGLVRVQLDSPFAVHGPAQGLTGGPRQLLRAGDRLYVTHGEGLAWRRDSDGQFESEPGFRTGSHRLIIAGSSVLVSALGLHELTATGADRTLAGPYLYALAEWRRQPGWLLASSALALRFFKADDTGAWHPAGQLATVPAGADDLLETDDGRLWMVTRTGELWRIDFRGGLKPDSPAQHYGPERGVPAALRRDGIRLVPFKADLLVSSARWLLRYDAKQDRFVPETRFPELVPSGGFVTPEGDAVGAAMTVPAADGGAWFYYERPAARIARLRPSPDGKANVEWIPAAQLQDLLINHLGDDPRLHALWVAGQGALISVDLDWRPAHVPVPVAAILRRVAGGDGTTLAGPHSPPLTLPPGHRTVRFEYAAPTFATDYRGQADTVYRTRLDGLDRDWTPWTREAQRDFTNLPPGPLTFRVEARDFTGRLSAETRLAFHQAPPWWRTAWAATLAGLLAVGLVTAIVKLRTGALRARARHLEAVVAERTRELERLRQLELDEKIAARLAEEKAQLEMLRYQLNPHFLFNALNSIYGLVYPHAPSAGDLVRQLADFCRGTLTRRGDQWQTLGQELGMLRTYLDIEQARWRDRLVITFSEDATADGLRLPGFLLLPLVDNAIKHGGATSPDVLSLRIATRAEADGSVVIEIANTGEWLAPGQPRAQPSTGIGMENLRSRLDRSFPGAHELTVSSADGWVVVRLRLFHPRPGI